MKLILFLGLIASTISFAQPRPEIKVPPEMQKLDFLVGTWKAHSKTMNKKGEVVYESDFVASFEKEMKGMLIMATTGRYDSDDKFEIGQRTWYFYDARAKLFMDVNFDIVGNFEIKTGNFDGDELIVAYPEPKLASDGVYRIWRKTMTAISKDSFTWIWHYTQDEGKTWIKQWHTTFIRTD
jgi:hypothetical protein